MNVIVFHLNLPLVHDCLYMCCVNSIKIKHDLSLNYLSVYISV